MWKKKVLPCSPTARRQTVGAWESCWMLQSWLPHNLTMPFVGCDTKLSQRHPVRKAPLFFTPSHFYMHDLTHVTVPERFLARCGQCDRRYWLLKVICHCFLSTSQVLKSFCSCSLPQIFSHFNFFPLSHPFCNWASALSCLSSLLLSHFLHALITVSIMPACLVWCRRMVSITCSKRDEA